MMVPVREYVNASEMVASLIAIRKRLIEPPPKPVIVEAEPPPPPVPVTWHVSPPSTDGEDIVPRFPTIAEIVNIVSAVWNIAPVHILSGRRTWECIFPRHVTCALACRLTTRSLPEIGRYIGGRDHSTVLHARNRMQPHMERVEARLPPDATVRQWAEEMLTEIGTGSVKQRRGTGNEQEGNHSDAGAGKGADTGSNGPADC
jgi:hypothetical protein